MTPSTVNSTDKKKLKKAFTVDGLPRSIFKWERFKSSLSHPGWMPKAKNLFKDVKDISDVELLNRWLGETSDDVPAISKNLQHKIYFVVTLGFVLGLFSMAGVMTYSGDVPVNIIVVLGLFAFLPLCFTLMVFVKHIYDYLSKKNVSPTSSLYSLLTIFSNPLQKIMLSQPVTAWLAWRLQLIAIVFQVGAIISFILIVLFKDIAFAWSSTIIEGGDWLVSLLQTITLPWSWLVEAPSREFIVNSRFFRAEQSYNADVLGQWWSYLLLAMITYGLIPRIALYLFLKSIYKKKLEEDILRSGDVERFIQLARAKNIDANKNIKIGDTKHTHTLVSHFYSAENTYIAWRNVSDINIDNILDIHLGLETWEKDETWIEENAKSIHHSIFVVVDINITPTGELADTVYLLREASSQNVDIVLHSKTAAPNTEYTASVESWQFFATKYSLNIYLGIQGS